MTITYTDTTYAVQFLNKDEDDDWQSFKARQTASEAVRIFKFYSQSMKDCKWRIIEQVTTSKVVTVKELLP